MKIAITSLDIGYYEEILALWEASQGVRVSDADTRDRIEAYLDRNPGMSFTAVSGGRIVGAILAGHDGRRGYIHHLAVHPEWRRKGIGQMLADRALKALAAAGMAKCHLFILNDNHEGLEFWKSLEWRLREDISVMSITVGSNTRE